MRVCMYVCMYVNICLREFKTKSLDEAASFTPRYSNPSLFWLRKCIIVYSIYVQYDVCMYVCVYIYSTKQTSIGCIYAYMHINKDIYICMLFHDMLFHVMLCYVMLCYVCMYVSFCICTKFTGTYRIAARFCAAALLSTAMQQVLDLDM